jgi:hypothetical protein
MEATAKGVFMTKIMISSFIASFLIVGCGGTSSAVLESKTSTKGKKLPLDEIGLMLSTNAMNPKCQFSDFNETAGADGKRLSFKFKYDQQSQKTMSLSEIPDATATWNVERGPLAIGYWRFSYDTVDGQSQTNLKNVDMTVDESEKKFQRFEITPSGQAFSTDCSAK